MFNFSKSIARQWSRIGPRGIYGQSLLEIAKKNKNIFAISADLGNSSGLERFSNSIPERFLNIGIAEQNMVGFSSGLSTLGFNVFISSFAPFITMRAGEQVRMNLSYMQSNVKLVSIGSGISMGFLGNSHFGLEDISIINSLPEIPIICPSDCLEILKATEALAKFNGPAYLRLTGASPAPIINIDDYKFEIGKSIILETGNDILILSHGIVLSNCLKAAADIRDNYGISVQVENVHTLRPLDIDLIERMHNYEYIFIIEEHSKIGGLGTIISDFLFENGSKNGNLFKIGLPPRFLKSGTYKQLMIRYGLDHSSIEKSIISKLKLDSKI